MSCPSCGAVHSLEECTESTADLSPAVVSVQVEGHPDEQEDQLSSATDECDTATAESRLIEFPVVNRRSVPAWRKELSDRVREVQERRAREAAAEKEEALRLQAQSAPQLELLPAVESPDVNPIVVAALRRLERVRRQPMPTAAPAYHPPVAVAKRARSPKRQAAPAQDPQPQNARASAEPVQRAVTGMTAATAAAPAPEIVSAPIPEPEPVVQAAPTLNVVPVTITNEDQLVEKPEEEIRAKPAPRRVLSENDPVLSYLDSVAGAYSTDCEYNTAPLFSRIVAGLIDLLVVGVLASPFAVLLDLQNGSWRDPKIAGIMSGIIVSFMFVYLTVTTALTGKTAGLKCASLRAIDSRTGLIPTGSQSAKRAIVYILSLITLGIGFLVAAANSERKTVHDRLSHTSVVRA